MSADAEVRLGAGPGVGRVGVEASGAAPRRGVFAAALSLSSNAGWLGTGGKAPLARRRARSRRLDLANTACTLSSTRSSSVFVRVPRRPAAGGARGGAAVLTSSNLLRLGLG
jgi:hypothetical protein